MNEAVTEPENKSLNVIELIERSAQRLENAGLVFGHGTSQAFDEAAWLVLWALKLPIDDLESVEKNLVSLADIDCAATLIEARIATRKPAAYLTQEAWLQGVAFYVDERVIVPRSFIAELLADGSIDSWLGAHTQRVLDLCTGNGSLAVLAAMAYPDVQVDAADISQDALTVAQLNIDKHQLAPRIRVLSSDGLQQCPGLYDLVLCNPPYVNSDSMAQLPAEYLAEPHIALAGGSDGMDFIRPLLRDLPQKMAPHAVLVLEIGNERAHFERAFPRLEAFWLETSAGEDQVLLLTREALALWSGEIGASFR
jgi:ribosomal protein L3 glutamine methyltransferase